MKKIPFTLAVIALCQIAPLLAAPALLLHWKMLAIMTAAALLWLSQPAIRPGEVQANRSSDRSTLWLILIAAGVSTVTPEMEWAYYLDTYEGLPSWNAFGLALMITGTSFRLWAIRSLGRYFTATVQTVTAQPLVSTGPYAVVRHPSYLGAYAAVLGCAVLLQAPVGFGVAAFTMFYAYYQRIKVEEQILKGYFGETYDHYAARVKRLLPGIW